MSRLTSFICGALLAGGLAGVGAQEVLQPRPSTDLIVVEPMGPPQFGEPRSICIALTHLGKGDRETPVLTHSCVQVPGTVSEASWGAGENRIEIVIRESETPSVERTRAWEVVIKAGRNSSQIELPREALGSRIKASAEVRSAKQRYELTAWVEPTWPGGEED